MTGAAPVRGICPRCHMATEHGHADADECIAAVRRPPCDVCRGQPLPSGRPCVCGGAGTQSEEVLGLRRAVYEAEGRAEAAQVRERAAVLVGALKAASARTAMRRCKTLLTGQVPNRMGQGLVVLDAALARLDDGGDAETWARALFFAGVRYAEGLAGDASAVDSSERAVRAALTAPPALPPAHDELAQAFVWARQQSGAGVHTDTFLRDLARRWLSTEGTKGEESA